MHDRYITTAQFAKRWSMQPRSSRPRPSRPGGAAGLTQSRASTSTGAAAPGAMRKGRFTMSASDDEAVFKAAEAVEVRAPSRRCDCSWHRGSESWHGRITGYRDHECRCDRCRGAKARYQQGYRQALKPTEPPAQHHAEWTRADDEIAMRADLKVAEITALLGRSVKAVEKRREAIRRTQGDRA